MSIFLKPGNHHYRLTQRSLEISEATREQWIRRSLWLIGLTLVYNVVEAVIAITSGIMAESVALIGFGFDSVIECAAAVIVYRRMRAEFRGLDSERLEAMEKRSIQFIGATFLALAAYVILQAGYQIWSRHIPEESMIGIALALVSLILMPLVAVAKLKAARKVNSASLRAEARETLACSMLSLVLLIGLGLYALFGWWWADPAAALCMTPWLIREGLEGLRGEGCCAHSSESDEI